MRPIWGLSCVFAVAACAHEHAPRASNAPVVAEPRAASTTLPASPTPDDVVAVPVEPPKPRAPRPGAYANLDPDDDFVVGPPDPRSDCDAELASAGVTFHRATLPVHKEGKIVCGSHQVVTYFAGPGKIAYSAPPLLTCGMALALASFEKILQSEADRVFHAKIARIDQLGTYSCRMVGAHKGTVSEHSYANALDIGSFTLSTGATVSVLRDFDVGEAEPAKRAGAFLRAVSRRANDEDVFSHVLTPFYDAVHRNHFHVDLARFRTDGTRPQGGA